MTTTKLNTCGDCAFNSVGYCMRNRMAVKPINYACCHFMTQEDRAAELEAKKQERLKKEEERLNFILTGMYIQATALMQGLEHFDAQFSSKEVEANWRFSRKRAANEIKRAVQKIRDIYRHKASLMIDCLEKELPKEIEFTRPEGGLFLWCTLPDGVDMNAFVKKAIEYKVAVVPGTTFNCDTAAPSNCFRLNYSTPSDEQIVEGCRRLGAVAREMLGKQ